MAPDNRALALASIVDAQDRASAVALRLVRDSVQTAEDVDLVLRLLSEARHGLERASQELVSLVSREALMEVRSA